MSPRTAPVFSYWWFYYYYCRCDLRAHTPSIPLSLNPMISPFISGDDVNEGYAENFLNNLAVPPFSLLIQSISYVRFIKTARFEVRKTVVFWAKLIKKKFIFFIFFYWLFWFFSDILFWGPLPNSLFCPSVCPSIRPIFSVRLWNLCERDRNIQYPGSIWIIIYHNVINFCLSVRLIVTYYWAG